MSLTHSVLYNEYLVVNEVDTRTSRMVLAILARFSHEDTHTCTTDGLVRLFTLHYLEVDHHKEGGRRGVVLLSQG